MDIITSIQLKFSYTTHKHVDIYNNYYTYDMMYVIECTYLFIVEKCHCLVLYIIMSAVLFSCSTNNVHGQTKNSRYILSHVYMYVCDICM